MGTVKTFTICLNSLEDLTTSLLFTCLGDCIRPRRARRTGLARRCRRGQGWPRRSPDRIRCWYHWTGPKSLKGYAKSWIHGYFLFGQDNLMCLNNLLIFYNYVLLCLAGAVSLPSETASNRKKMVIFLILSFELPEVVPCVWLNIYYFVCLCYSSGPPAYYVTVEGVLCVWWPPY